VLEHDPGRGTVRETGHVETTSGDRADRHLRALRRSQDVILDLFSGPRGWSEGLKMLGLSDVGIEWDMAACLTAQAAGHPSIRADVATYPTEPFAGRVEGLIVSAPCTDFSLAGLGAGIEGKTGRLITEVMRWTVALRPQWVACENVPKVLPIFRWFAHEMRQLGYSVWVGVLNAADYGVPQTRRRAFLIASLDRQVTAPTPTHSRDAGSRLFGDLSPWVTMADALGWGMNKRPSVTIMAKGASGGGLTGFLDGGSGARARLAAEQIEGRWVYRDGTRAHAATRTIDEPATTVVSSFCPEVIAAPGYRTKVSRQNAPGSVKVTIAEAGVLQSFRRDYPWQGATTKQYQQVGNAVPPLLAAHVISAVTGIDLARDCVQG
jgi:DNA (cytosine-5)-methyltransferase 1